MQISTWVSSQKLRLISAAVRVNMQFLRLRNQHELDAVIEELSALLPKEQLYRLSEQATREPYSFLFLLPMGAALSFLVGGSVEETAAVAAEEGEVAVAAEGVGGAFGYLEGAAALAPTAGEVAGTRRSLRPRALRAQKHALPAPAGQRGRPCRTSGLSL